MSTASTNGVQWLFWRQRQRGGTFPERMLRHLGLSLKRQWKRYRKELKRCQKRFSEKAVHQSRVETRRLLSIVELLDPFMPAGRLDKIRDCLKRHLDTFDDLRDTHVQLLIVRELRRTYPEADLFHRHLRKCEERYGRKTRKNIKRIRTKRLGKLIAACRSDSRVWQTTGTPDQINSMLVQAVDAAFRRTTQLKAAIDPADTETIHRTRVAFKKFRYMMELLAEFLPNGAPELVASMHAYQILMGDVQDIEVLRLGFEKFAGKEAIAAKAQSEFRRELQRRKQELITRYIRRADELDTFWQRPAMPKTNGDGTTMHRPVLDKPGAAHSGRSKSLRKKTGP
jgi:CHAD domain-containing protein